MYKKILVPHDGSQYSARAAEKAMEIASLSGAKLVFVSVSTIPSLVYSYRQATNAAINEVAQDLVDFSKDTSIQTLKDLVFQCNKKDIAASSAHRVGDPAKVILGFAKSEGADLIVMGSRGLSGVSKLKALGSVARKVSENASCPVLLVR